MQSEFLFPGKALTSLSKILVLNTYLKTQNTINVCVENVIIHFCLIYRPFFDSHFIGPSTSREDAIVAKT